MPYGDRHALPLEALALFLIQKPRQRSASGSASEVEKEGDLALIMSHPNALGPAMNGPTKPTAKHSPLLAKKAERSMPHPWQRRAAPFSEQPNLK